MLNGNFVKASESFPYCGFLEPWQKNGKKLLGLEIFFSSKLTLKDALEEEEDTKTEVEDWADHLDREAMQLFDQDGDVFILDDEEAAKEELATMITPADGITSSWIFYDDSNSIFPNVEQFATYPFYPINEMNFDFAYFDVSFSSENLTAKIL